MAQTINALSTVWNSAGTTFTAFKFDVTDSASAAGSLLMDLRVGTDSKFSVSKAGAVTLSADAIILRDAANTLAQRNSTSAQTFRLYNTYTDASNYERAKIAWSSNTLLIGTEKAGTGTARALELQTDGTTRVTIGATGQVAVGAGSVGAPSICFSGDTSTGIWSVSSGNVSVSVSGVERYRFGSGGVLTASAGLAFGQNAAVPFARIDAGADGVAILSNGAQTNFGRLQFGGTTSSFPALKRDSTTLKVRLADDSADAAITAAAGTFSGAVTAPNLANGRSMGVFTPMVNQPPASNFATLDTRNSVAVLDFDAATAESAVFVGVLPQAATLTSGIKVRVFWAATSATSGDCRWKVEFEKFGTDIDADSFDTAATGTTTTSGTSGIVVVTEITITTIDSLAAGDQFRLRVTRDAADAADTMTGDAELVAVEIQQVA